MVERVWMLMEITDVGSRKCLLAQLEIHSVHAARTGVSEGPALRGQSRSYPMTWSTCPRRLHLKVPTSISECGNELGLACHARFEYMNVSLILLQQSKRQELRLDGAEDFVPGDALGLRQRLTWPMCVCSSVRKQEHAPPRRQFSPCAAEAREHVELP